MPYAGSMLKPVREPVEVRAAKLYPVRMDLRAEATRFPQDPKPRYQALEVRSWCCLPFVARAIVGAPGPRTLRCSPLGLWPPLRIGLHVAIRVSQAL